MMATSAAALPPHVEQFMQWMRDNGITWNEQLVKLVNNAVNCGGYSLGIQAVADIQEGNDLCIIPKESCLSVRTSSITDILEAEGLGVGGIALVVAVMVELSRGTKSKWHGYFTALPSCEYLPMFWNDEEAALLVGTELDNAPAKDREDVEDDFATLVKPLLDKYPDRFTAQQKKLLTLDHFCAAASLVASRAFGIDEYHGDAMVPLADIFNHKVSVVDLAPGYQVHGAESSDDDDDDDDGDDDEEEEEEEEEEELSDTTSSSDEEEEHAHDGGESSDDVVHEDDLLLADGVVNGGNHQDKDDTDGNALHVFTTMPTPMRPGTEATVHGLATANGLHLRLEIAIVDDDDEGNLKIVAASDVAAGNEVHNTYGELSNALLVNKYGFAVAENPLTAVSLDKQEVLQCLQDVAMQSASKKQCTANYKHLEAIVTKETELVDDDSEPFEVLPNGHIGPALYAITRALRTELIAKKSGIKNIKTFQDCIALDNVVEEEEQLLLEGINGPVQIWPVLSPDNGQLDDAAAAAVHDVETEDSTLQRGFTGSMLQAIKQAIEQRCSKYPTALEETEAEYSKLVGGDNQATALSDHQTAVRCAVLLRLTEQRLLRDAVRAIDIRLGKLGAVDGSTKAQEQPPTKRAKKK